MAKCERRNININNKIGLLNRVSLFVPGSEAASIVVTLLWEMSMKVAGEVKDSCPCCTVVI